MGQPTDTLWPSQPQTLLKHQVYRQYLRCWFAGPGAYLDGFRESRHKPVTKRGRSVHAPWDASRAGAAPRATGSGLPGRHWGVTRQALLLDVKEALVDEFVDAEGA